MGSQLYLIGALCVVVLSTGTFHGSLCPSAAQPQTPTPVLQPTAANAQPIQTKEVKVISIHTADDVAIVKCMEKYFSLSLLCGQ